MPKYLSKYFSSKIIFIIFILLLGVQIFTRFSYPDTKSDFSWDQIDNAWAAKNIIYDHKLPLVGMQAKGNTGFYIGPYYYYLITPFYIATDLDPYASIIIAGFTSIVMFFLTYLLVKSMLGENIALFATFFEVFSFYIIGLDRTQWPVNLIAPVSLIIFYSLFKIMNGKSMYIVLLVAAFGFSLHVHFTSVFYVPLILLCLPFFPRKKQTLKYILMSVPIFIFFLFPIIVATLGKSSSNIASYLSSSYLGIHLRRLLQISHDGFIEFEGIASLKFFKEIGQLLFPTFLLISFVKLHRTGKVYLVYLSLIWVILPWLFFATYGGELSNYYFSITRPVVFIALAYLLYMLFEYKRTMGKVGVFVILLSYVYVNSKQFFEFKARGLGYYREKVDEKIKNGTIIEFGQGNPESYLYFIKKERYDREKK